MKIWYQEYWRLEELYVAQGAAKSLTPSSMELNVGTFDVRGLSKEYAKYALSEDLETYRLDIVSVQETKIG